MVESVYLDVQAALLNSECSPEEALQAALRACCDSYQVVEYDKGWVKVSPVVTRAVQTPAPVV